MRLLAIFLLLLSSSPVFALSFSGKVVKVSDGDTIQVMHEGKAEKVRLAGIDCPEKGQPFGNAAKQYVLDLAANQFVTVDAQSKDRYGRTIGEVFLPNGDSLNRLLVSQGFAWHYKKYSSDASISRLEEHARLSKVGLWRDKEPIAPWQWRQDKRKKKD